MNLEQILILKKGGIHIKKKNRGKFTESAKRAGMGVQEYARHVLANKDKYSSTLVKRANFARNAKKFKHEDGGILKYQNPSETLPELIQRINKKSKANFVKRLLDPNRKSIQDWVAPLNIATHKLGWATEDTKQGAFVYPEVQEINGELVDFTNPKYRRSEGINSAIERRDTVRMTPEQAKWFTENYKQYYPGFQNGGNLLTPHPLSPVGIALNTAKAVAKGKKDQQHLPPGIKEVVGPNGKKVAIRTEQPLVPLEQDIAEWMPGTGDVAEVGYIANDVKNGRYGSAALATAMIALPGNVGKIFRKSDVPTSKLTEAERLGIPKGERNQPAKAPTKNQTYKKIANLKSDKDYLEDIEAIHQGFLGKTFLDSEHEALLDWFNSPQYKERLVKQGFSEEQINNLLSNIKDKLSRKNLKYAVDLNSIREWGIGSGGALKIDPQLYPAYEAMTNGNIKVGGHPINWSLIQLKKGVDLDEMIPHEVGGHHLESLVAEFNEPYTSQQITEIGKKATISSGLPEGYYPSWWETRARALTIAKQMREAGWNPNSSEQVNVWLNKHLLKDHNTNVVQGALYYDRPGFIKAISEGLKNGGKL